MINLQMSGARSITVHWKKSDVFSAVYLAYTEDLSSLSHFVRRLFTHSDFCVASSQKSGGNSSASDRVSSETHFRHRCR
jgi:hypothetical protein